MIKTMQDRQPGLGTTGISGTLTLTKTGTTARTATFPDAAIVVSGSAAALTSGRVPYVTTGGLLTDNAALTWSGTVFATTSTTANSLQTAGGVAFDGTGTNRGFRYLTTGVNRWIANLSGTETGSDAGGNWQLLAYTDAGVLIDTPLSITRAAGGAITLARPVTCTGVVTVPNGTAAAPGIRLTSEASGLYRVSSTSLGFAVAGTASASLTSAGAFAATSLTASGLTSGRVPYVTTGGLLTDDALLTYSAAVLTVGGASSGALILNGPTGGTRGIYFRSASSNRFVNSVSGTESGANAGSNYAIDAYTDASAYIDSPLSIVRAAGGAITLARPVTCTNTTITSIQTSGGMTFASIAAATTDGGLQRESNQEKLYAYANGIGGWLDKCIFSQYASVTQTGIVTSQSLASATARGTRTLPANFFKQGKVMRFRLCGRYTTDAVAGNATVDLKLGSTTFRTTGSYALDASSTNLPWEIEGEVTCYTTGATGTVEGVAWWAHGITGATGNFNIEPMAGTGTVTIDTTAAQAFDVQWTATDAGTAITCTCFRMWEVC